MTATTISDTERREVARRLLDYADLPDDWWQETCAEFYVEKCVFGNVDRHSEAELFTRLAYLIKPSDMSQDRRDIVACDRDELLALADRMENMAGMGALLTANGLETAAASIREALGVVES